MIWVVKTNTNNCQIYEFSKKPSTLSLIKEIGHPEFKQKSSENLTTERPGRYSKVKGMRSAYEPSTDPKEVEIDNFCKEIAKILETGRVNHSYDQLVIIAEPRMYGLLNQQMTEKLKTLIFKHIPKDLLNINQKEFLEILKENTLFPIE